jgi:hypothetical protein
LRGGFRQELGGPALRRGPPLGIINFAASIEDKSWWNSAAGGEYNISDDWSLMAEGGFGGRDQVLAGVTHRF